MPRSAPPATFWPIGWHEAVSSLLFLAALTAALFHNGELTQALSLALALLLVWLGWVLTQGYRSGLAIPVDGLTLSLTLFCAWLGISVFLSRVPYVSAINFWWITAIGSVFWLVTLAPSRDRIFTHAFRGAVIIGIFLVITATYQRFIEGSDPRALFFNHNAFAAFLALLSFPLAARLLLGFRHAVPRKAGILTLTGAALGLLHFGIAITGGRGVALSTLIALVILVLVTWRYVPRRAMGVLLCIIIGAHVLANLATQGFVSTRLTSLLDGVSVANHRLVIWEAAWRLLQDSPWYGIGLGTFWLSYPPYRLPADISAGYYVHNDYLQIWIENGWPGLLFFLATLVCVLYLFVRALRYGSADRDNRIAITGAFCGLLAVAMHSFIDFNLYALPILILAGLVLGEFHHRYQSLVPGGLVWRLQPSKYFGERAYRVIIMFLMLFPLGYFASLGFSAFAIARAQSLVTNAKWVEADEWMWRAARASPASDLPAVIHADMARQAIAALPISDDGHRRALFAQSLEMLERAEQLNPLRPFTFMTRGLLYHDYPQLADRNTYQQAAHNYEQALKLDPRFHWARSSLALLLRSQGKGNEARRVLEEGAVYSYYPDAMVLPYYTLIAQARRQDGEIKRAEEIERIINQIKTKYVEAARRPHR